MKKIILFCIVSINTTVFAQQCVTGDCVNGTGTVLFPDSSSLTCTFKNGQPIGKAKAVYRDGAIYIGDWDGNSNGFGILTTREGNRYEGEFKAGKQHGKGTFTTFTNKKYIGDWVNGKKEGRGRYEQANGDYYDGYWKNDKQDGMGEMKVGGKSYVGIWANGEYIKDAPVTNCIAGDCKEGRGTYQDANGKYEGEWRDGRPSGKGKIEYANGESYQGDFVDGIRAGQGSFVSKLKGTAYEGEWEMDAPNGVGKMTFSDGSVFEGDVMQWRPQGKGVLKSLNGMIYTGEFVEGKATGIGKLEYPSGDVFEGGIKNGVPHGKGKATYKKSTNGLLKIVEGYWENGNFSHQ
jgi:hypothetical protein